MVMTVIAASNLLHFCLFYRHGLIVLAIYDGSMNITSLILCLLYTRMLYLASLLVS